MEITYSVDNDNDFIKNKKILGFIGEYSDIDDLIYDKKEIYIKDNKRVKSLRLNEEDYKNLGLSEEYKNFKYGKLPDSYKKLICLIKIASLKPNVIILNNFDLGLNYKLKSKLSKYIKTINALYHTAFIIISNDYLFINKCSKNIVIAKKGIIKYQGDIITAFKQNLLVKPPILEFIDLANEKGAKIDYTLDSKELLKSIYRSVF